MSGLRVRVTREFTFDAAHYLPGYDGDCSRMHGHTYKMHVTVSMPESSMIENKGMVMDFKVLNDIVKKHIISMVDHKLLNESLPVSITTAEIMVCYFLDKLRATPELVEKGMRVDSVKLWETPNSFAEVADDI